MRVGKGWERYPKMGKWEHKDGTHRDFPNDLKKINYNSDHGLLKEG